MARTTTVVAPAAAAQGGNDLLKRAGTKAISDNPKRANWKRCFTAIWALWVPFFKDPAVRLKAFALLLGTIVLISLEVFGRWKMLELTKSLTNAIVERKEDEFWANIKVTAAVSLCIGLGFFVQHVVAGTLALEWRRYLTSRLLAKYISSDQAFYKMRMQDVDIDNPDQRIAQDVSEFTNMTAFLLQRLTQDLGTILASMLTISQKTPASSLMMFGGSVIVAFIVLQLFSPPLMRVQRRLLGLEADLRYILMRLRENAESIAFFQGADLEKEQSEFFLARAIRAAYTNLFLQSGFLCVLGMIKQVGNFSCYFYIAPMFFDKTVFPPWTAGDLKQAHDLSMYLHASVIDFVKEVDKIASLGAQAVRIMEIQEVIERYGKARHRDLRGVSYMDDASTDAGESSDEEDGEDNELVEADSDADDDSDEGGVRVRSFADGARERLLVSDLTLLPPVGAFPLVKHLSFAMYEEDSVLLTGPSGAGKSTLLRMIGGLYTRGSGVIHRTALKRTFFVPQNPYLYEGSLRENVMYPQSAAVTPIDMVEQDRRIISILETLGIGYLVDRHGLDEGVEFDKMLSGGEKQRLNFARILVRDPGDLAFVLLDEATSALDERNEDIVYDLLRRSVRCYISVGHRMNLKKFHTKRLVLERAAEGGCSGHLTDCLGVGAA